MKMRNINPIKKSSDYRGIKYIVLHHSATDYQANAEDTTGKQIARTICDRAQEKWKKEFPDYRCDYHFIIGHTGEVFKAQPIEQPAWHCTNYQANLVSIGICFLGNFENIEMPTEQFNAGIQLIKTLMSEYNVPLVNVLRHRDVVSDITHTANSTECPGKNFPYIHILDALRDGEPFFDIGEDYPYINEVKFLKQLGIIKGDGKGNLKPHEYITREEAMIISYKIIKLLQN
jgi:N-acetyl-anhydromuramyl-L-alanine amidase AmpD